jgi:hypothetical protein
MVNFLDYGAKYLDHDVSDVSKNLVLGHFELLSFLAIYIILSWLYFSDTPPPEELLLNASDDKLDTLCVML